MMVKEDTSIKGKQRLFSPSKPSRRQLEKRHHHQQQRLELSPSEQVLALVSLSVATLTHGYLLSSIFAYHGFMVLDFIVMTTRTANIESDAETNANAKTEIEAETNSVGYYSGLLISAFFLGHALARSGWIQAADSYGRTTVLFSSLQLSCIFSCLFGLSPTLGMALVWRLFLGLGNGILDTVKITVTEIIHAGDSRLDCTDQDKAESIRHAMGLMGTLWVCASVLGPYIAGRLVQVTQQYPFYWSTRQDTLLYQFLQEYPYFIPNAVGSGLCLWSIFLLNAFCPETLPKSLSPQQSKRRRRGGGGNGDNKQRDTTVLRDLFTSFHSILSTIPEGDEGASSSQCLRSFSDVEPDSKSDYGSFLFRRSGSSRSSDGDIDDEDAFERRESILQFARDDFQDAIHASILLSTQDEAALLAPHAWDKNKNSLASLMTHKVDLDYEELRMNQFVHMGSYIVVAKEDQVVGACSISFLDAPSTDEENIVATSKEGDDQAAEATVVSPSEAATLAASPLWTRQASSTRQYLMLYWLAQFARIAVDEALPLFFLSQGAGLGYSSSPKSVGTILAAAAAGHLTLQYLGTYTKLIKTMGLYQSLQLSFRYIWPLLLLIPAVSMFSTQGWAVFQDEEEEDNNAIAGDYNGDEKLRLDDLQRQEQLKRLHSSTELTWPALLYLAGILAVFRMLVSCIMASLMVIVHRTVIPEHRHALNQLCSSGTLVVQILAPCLSSVLVALCFTSFFFEDKNHINNNAKNNNDNDGNNSSNNIILAAGSGMLLWLIVASMWALLALLVWLQQQRDNVHTGHQDQQQREEQGKTCCFRHRENENDDEEGNIDVSENWSVLHFQK